MKNILFSITPQHTRTHTPPCAFYIHTFYMTSSNTQVCTDSLGGNNYADIPESEVAYHNINQDCYAADGYISKQRKEPGLKCI